MTTILQSLLTWLGRGPVWSAIVAELKKDLKTVEAQYKTDQMALLEEFKDRQAALLQKTAKTFLQELINVNN